MSQSKVFTGVLWAAVQRFGTMIISFVANIVLARLLTPDDFGTVGMLLFFLSIANVFVDSGFGSALIQKKDATDNDCSTVFVINIVLSAVLYVILFVCAPFIARFYKVPLLKPILRVQGLVVFFNAFSIVQSTLLRKKLDFKKLSVVNIVGSFVGTVVAITLAACGCGVWSLVVRVLLVSLIVSILLWKCGDWKFSFFFDKQSFKGLFNFGGFILLSSVITTISGNIQTLIIGRLFAPSTLGNYTQARNLRNICTDSVSLVIGQVLYPSFSSHQDDNNSITQQLNSAVYIISYVVAALMALCFVLAKPLILLLYGSQWVTCIQHFRVLCLGGVFLSIQDVNYYVTAAKGHSKTLFYFNLIKVCIYILLLYFGGKYFGMIGLLYSMVGYAIIAYFFYSLLSSHFLASKAVKQYLVVIKSILISLVPAGITWLAMPHISNLPNIIQICIAGLIYALVFIFISVLFKPLPFRYLQSRIRPILQRKKLLSR